MTMKRIALAGLMFALALTAITAGYASPTHAADVKKCQYVFEAEVRTGPSAGAKVEGTLTLEIDQTGAAVGFVQTLDGEVPVFGQVTGRALNMTLELAPGDAKTHPTLMYGTGSARNPITGEDCGKYLGGTFAGPALGDLGDWAGCLSGEPCIISAKR